MVTMMIPLYQKHALGHAFHFPVAVFILSQSVPRGLCRCAGVCVSLRGRWNDVPRTTWLKTTEVTSLTVLEAGSLASGRHQGCIPSENAKAESFPSSLCTLGGGGWQSSTFLSWYSTTPVSAPVLT